MLDMWICIEDIKIDNQVNELRMRNISQNISKAYPYLKKNWDMPQSGRVFGSKASKIQLDYQKGIKLLKPDAVFQIHKTTTNKRLSEFVSLSGSARVGGR